MKTAVVTGASTGIGWGCAKVLIEKGFRVFGSVRKKTDAERLSAELGSRFVPLLFDVTDEGAVHKGDLGGAFDVSVPDRSAEKKGNTKGLKESRTHVVSIDAGNHVPLTGLRNISLNVNIRAASTVVDKSVSGERRGAHAGNRFNAALHFLV